MKPQEMVKEFHQVFKAYIKEDGPDWLKDKDLLNLRMELIREEWQELQDAVADEDLIETVDALADMIYVIYGFALSLGVDLDDVLAEVHRSNMTKLDAYGNPIFREDGKVIKSELFEQPEIALKLYQQTPTTDWTRKND